MTSQSDAHGLTAMKDRSMMEQHEELRRSSVIALTDEQIRRMAADGQDPSRFSYRVWQQAVRQLLGRRAERVAQAYADVGKVEHDVEFTEGGALDELPRMGQEFDAHQPGETDGT